MDNDKLKFRRFIAKLENDYGPQGWWPRLVVDRSTIVVKHHPGPKSRWLFKTAADQAFEVAIGAILTQNTAWTNVEKALVCLAEKGLITSAAISKVRINTLEACVRSSGYYRQKAKKLKLFAKFVQNELGGDLNQILPARSRLLSLWGIGPETADTILLYGLNVPIFVVDAYTRRLLIHLTGDKSWSKQPYDQVRQFCEEAFGKSSVKEMQEAHALIVKWGKSSHSVIPAKRSAGRNPGLTKTSK